MTEQMWCAAEDCSRSVQWRLEMLGRHRLRGGYEQQTVRETKRNADAFETHESDTVYGLATDSVCRNFFTPWHLLIAVFFTFKSRISRVKT